MLNRVTQGSSSDIIAKMLYVLMPEAKTVLDVTYGDGVFWDTAFTGLLKNIVVTGIDLNPAKANNECIVGDFRHLTYNNNEFDVVIFDPPFQTDSGKDSIMAKKYSSYDTLDDMHIAISQGIKEAWRVAKVGIVVKVQDHIHGAKLVRMTEWIDELVPVPLYDYVMLQSSNKIDSYGDLRPLSVRSNACTFMAYRKDGNVHKRRFF